ncbi:MAG: glycosyltransferase [Chloroflexota bacterium]
MGIRVVVVDDNPHVRWRGRVYPRNATFHRFLAAFLDLPGSPVASIAHAVPLRELRDDAPEPQTLPVDRRIATVATAPFDGIAGYFRHAPRLLARNSGVLRAAVRDADLVWIKVPASNAAVAAVLAVALGKPRFVWVAGSALDVARARYEGPQRVPGAIAGAVYDAIGRLVAAAGVRVVVGHALTTGGGVATSLVEDDEIRAPAASWPHDLEHLRLIWVGRLVRGKGIEPLLEAIAAAPRTTTLDIVGDGPARPALVALAASLRVDHQLRWHGYVADRTRYLNLLASADALVFPSPSEGFPKVLLDAMAVGLPVLASPVGSVSELIAADIIDAVEPGDARYITTAVNRLARDPQRAVALRNAGLAFVRDHTRAREASRVADLWRTRWPALAATTTD